MLILTLGKSQKSHGARPCEEVAEVTASCSDEAAFCGMAQDSSTRHTFDHTLKDSQKRASRTSSESGKNESRSVCCGPALQGEQDNTGHVIKSFIL